MMSSPQCHFLTLISGLVLHLSPSHNTQPRSSTMSWVAYFSCQLKDSEQELKTGSPATWIKVMTASSSYSTGQTSWIECHNYQHSSEVPPLSFCPVQRQQRKTTQSVLTEDADHDGENWRHSQIGTDQMSVSLLRGGRKGNLFPFPVMWSRGKIWAFVVRCGS